MCMSMSPTYPSTQAMMPIFVFGSNTAGRHGAGAALTARREHGAVYGVGSGRTGNSYAIPTKDGKLNILPLKVVARLVDQFKRYALLHPELTFNVTRVGCGLAGHADWEIAPMFKGSPDNCLFDESWVRYLHEGARTWRA